jgi:hypothetical protein
VIFDLAIENGNLVYYWSAICYAIRGDAPDWRDLCHDYVRLDNDLMQVTLIQAKFPRSRKWRQKRLARIWNAGIWPARTVFQFVRFLAPPMAGSGTESL